MVDFETHTGETTDRVNANHELRKYERILVDLPGKYEVHGTAVSCRILNACEEGVMVEALLSLRLVLNLLEKLRRRGRKPLFLEFRQKETYLTEVEMKYFHLQFLGDGLCQTRAGLHLLEKGLLYRMK
jgi:hypothetical protein